MNLERLPTQILAVADFFSELARAAWWLRYRAPHLLNAIRSGERLELDEVPTTADGARDGSTSSASPRTAHTVRSRRPS